MSLKFFTINCLTIFPGALHQSDVWSQDWTGQNFRQEVLMRKCLCLRVRPTTTTRTPIMQRRSRCRTSGSKVTLSTRPQVQPRWGIDWEMRLNSLFSLFLVCRSFSGEQQLNMLAVSTFYGGNSTPKTAELVVVVVQAFRASIRTWPGQIYYWRGPWIT